MQIFYRPSVKEIIPEDNVETIYRKVITSYKKNRPNEIRKGTTLSGPHRDDLEFLINEKMPMILHLKDSNGRFL
ncbi:hypothetical protein HMPREF9209_1605 [Lactobacillus gasseri 224-1]|uniref:Uncharacterized protein n=1 Tax=Lactobacillus gasseri 224-1 TaxID=679196 RepID=D1YKC6_LACGS|nr:hypothetical protein HMPREF9209_1605 [Lactobacillus gasseri 224-1]